MKQYLRAHQIAENLCVSEATIWRWVSEGRFPAPFRPTKRTTIWASDEIQEAIDQMKAAQIEKCGKRMPAEVEADS